MTKTCSQCSEEKNLEDFVKRSKSPDGRAGYCKACQSNSAAAKFAENPEERARKERNRAASRDRAREFLWTYLLHHPCVDCKIGDPRVLHFDHLDAKLKTRNVTEMMSWGIPAIQREIDKCVVRCANCHMIRTQEQFSHWRGRKEQE